MSTPIPIAQASLRWHLVELALLPQNPGQRSAHPLVILRGLIKSIGARCNPPPLAFHVRDAPVRALPKLFNSGEPVPLEVALFTTEPEPVAQWLDALCAHLDTEPRANHRLLGAPQTRLIDFQSRLPTTVGEAVELEFLTPLPFRPQRGRPPTALSLETFTSKLHGRAQSLFQLDLVPPDLTGVRLQAEYWGYHKIDAPSHSQPGHTEWLHGGLGPLWLRGDLGALMPWLELATAMHAGGKHELNPLGYCRLYPEPRPHFDRWLARPGLYRNALEQLASKQEDTKADLGLLLAPRNDGRGHPDPCRLLAEKVADGQWQPTPAQSFPLPKHDGVRWAERFEPETQLVLSVIHGLLQEPFDRMFSAASFGFRPGKSVAAAMEQVQQAIAAGYRFIARTDIHDCFPSIDLARLRQQLDAVLPPADRLLRQLLDQLLSLPTRKGELTLARERGLAQGSPLSPLFTNLYLDPFDRAFEQAPGRLVRFADDIALLARSHADAEALLALAQQSVAALGLSLNAEKTLITDADSGFTFLGQTLDTDGALAASIPRRPPLRKTLYITEIGAYLGNNGDAVEIRRRERPLEVIPLRRLASIVLLAPASLSTGLIGRCARAGVPITVAPGGRVSALVAPETRGFLETSAQQAQHWQALEINGRLEIAKRLAEAKMRAYQHLLRQRYAAGINQVTKFIDQQIDALATAADHDVVRGLEGVAARRIQRAIDGFVRVPEFHFAHRARFEPDQMNPLFNMGYHLLFGRLSALLRGAGLNPWLGYLHDAGDAYESLTCDLQEPFRAPVDRMLLALVNRREVRSEHFQPGSRGPRMQPEAVRTIAAGFEAMLHDARQQPTLAQAIDAQVESVRRFVLGRDGLWIYHWGQADPAAPDAGDPEP